MAQMSEQDGARHAPSGRAGPRRTERDPVGPPQAEPRQAGPGGAGSGAGAAPAIIVLGPGALTTAQRVRACLPGARIHGLARRVETEQSFTALGPHLRALYLAGHPIIGLCAAGILIRCLADVIGASLSPSVSPSADPSVDPSAAASVGSSPGGSPGGGAAKTREPPVLALAEDGSAVVPLLGGLAGVNTLARRIAAALDVAPAITTSGELRFGACLLDPPAGYVLADLEQGKHFVSDLLAGAAARIEGSAPWLDELALPRADDARLSIRVTASLAPDDQTDSLVIHPRAVVAAVVLDQVDAGANARIETSTGAAGGVDVEAIAGAVNGVGVNASEPVGTDRDADIILAWVRAALRAQRIAPAALAVLLADAAQIGNGALADAAARLGVPLRFVDCPVAIDSPRQPALAPAHVLRAAGLTLSDDPHDGPNATDADADAGAGADATRPGPWNPARAAAPPEAAPRVALHVADRPIDVDTVGRKRGTLRVVGIGPGSKALLAPAARDALHAADDILGYTTYVDMAGPFDARQRVRGTDNREEMQRARHALELAASGRDVVLVSSGDPGVFAMAAAVFEALEADAHGAMSGVLLEIVPGISAAMAAAACAGAPLGHDFCILSLSDNLKPWSVIERRLRLAAEADLVMAFYNPISRARPWQLERAFAIVRASRAPATPVVLGRDIGRPGATLRTVTLDTVRADQVDMRTMVIIGSSTTRRFTTGHAREWVYTPRWYPEQGV
ncbi:MAG: precorrin-3B C(17)-methyltransferase [Janthinobacterium lividum]